MTGRGVASVMQFIRRITTPRSEVEATDAQLLLRFAQKRDQAAFAALVTRHGPTVWGVCERVLRQTEDAEDAFQATFLVLARKAGAIGRPALLGNWLYGVACRTAQEAKGKRFRRQAKERQHVPPPSGEETPHLVWSDLRPVLDQEVNGLPDKYRTPFVLCHLNGMTNEEAARHMGCPAGTVMSRLAWARERLRVRLTQRGITLTGGLLAAALTQATLAAMVPPLLAESTIKAAALLAAGQTLKQVASANVAALTERTLQAMLFSKLKNVSLLLLCTAILGVTGGGLLFQARALPQEQPAEAPAKMVSIKQADIDDLAELLRVTRRSGRVDLRDQLSGGYLIIDFYRAGQKQEKKIQGAGFGIGTLAKGKDRYDRVDFAMQAMDLDYLQVGDGKKAHCRVLLKTVVVGPSAPLSSYTQDVPKELFDFSQARSGGNFSAEASSGRLIPLFWLHYGSNRVSGASTVQGIVERNPEANLAIVSLQLDE